LVGSPRYLLESIEVVGNRRTRSGVIRLHVPLERGDVIDADSGDLEVIEWRLRGTGWFDEVHLRLRRGSERGWVVLVVEVRERNTMVIRDLVFGISEGLSGSRDPNADILPYVGFSIAETNLTGTGIALSLGGLMSQTQQGADLGFVHPSVRASQYALRAGGFLNNAREFYGNDPIISQTCPDDVPECVEEVAAKNAVVFYRRGGIRLGFARGAGSSTHYSLDWQGEVVRVLSRPEAASTMRGSEPRPIDFAVQDGTSFVSVLRLGLLYDRRDDPGIPTEGVFVSLKGDIGSRLLGSSYDFVRLEALARYWYPIRPRHVLRLSGYAGVVFGEPPFFYKFHVSDFSDLLPSRVLEMQIDRRAANDFFGTPIRFMSNEEIAVRVDVQYDYSIYRTVRRPSLRGLSLYANVGLFALADPLDMKVAVPGFDGIARAPIDLTFDLGIIAETTIGVFRFGFSNLLGF
ncbi:MAG: BamA/TamA family outer membrane protein, partial [Polyangiaceae bacterium]|nr:BamA/TamA family outer membrane protein [Polyangiaceae bacterium]